LIIQIGAYSVFNMYRISRHAQIHLATTFGVMGIILACIHFLGRYNTLLSNQVNLFQKSVVHGLSYTDKLINLQKAYNLYVCVTSVEVMSIILSCIHFLCRYNTLLSNQVNLFQKSVVHGLSYTDKVINLPKSYILAVLVLILTVWIVVTLFRGNIMSSIKPLALYIVAIVLVQVASM